MQTDVRQGDVNVTMGHNVSPRDLLLMDLFFNGKPVFFVVLVSYLALKIAVLNVIYDKRH